MTPSDPRPVAAGLGVPAATVAAAPAPTSRAVDESAKPRASAPKLGNVQALRAIAVLMVFAVHVGNPYGFEARYLGGDWLAWTNLPGQAGVDLFFVISGLIMTVTTWNTAPGAPSARTFMARRAKRIFPIYWIVTLLVLAVYLVSPALVNSHSSHAPEILQSFTLLPQPGLPLLAVGWTLTYEMAFYLIFALALWLGRRWLPVILALWGAITITLAIAIPHTTSPLGQLASNPLSLEFLLGVAVGYLVMSRPPSASLATLVVGAILFVASAALAAKLYPVHVGNWYRAMTIGPAAALVVLGAVGLEQRQRHIAPKPLQYVGDASYSIYLWHTLLLVAAGKVISYVLPTVDTPLHAILLVATPIAILAGTLVLYRRVEQPINALMRQRPWARARRAPAAA